MLNRKCLAALAAAGEGKWDYAHVSTKGVTCTDTSALIRVSLPKTLVSPPSEARVFPVEELRDFEETLPDDCIDTIGEGLEPKTGPRFSVPALDQGILDTKKEKASVAVDAKRLIDVLKAACVVTDHERSLIRLRIVGNAIRIDAHRAENEQEFVGILMGINYNGACIPGDPTETGQNITETVDQTRLALPATEGRKFR